MDSSDHQTSAPRLVEQFASLWFHSESPPDVFDFLGQHADANARDKVDVLLLDQAHRWRSNTGLPVAAYLEKLPEIAAEKDFVLELLVGEYVCRGDAVELDGVLQCFTGMSEDQLRELVQQQLEHSTKAASAAPSSDIPPVPSDLERIGRYLVLSVLGNGAFGQVYLALDEDLARKVAIKIPRRERISAPEDVEQFLAEAQVLAGLEHPHIVPVFDVGRTDDGLCFVVSKFVEGGDLEKRIRTRRPEYEVAVELIATVAEALHYAHTHGLVHRDIKPANILLDAKGNPYVVDFGLALKEEDYGRGPKVIAGTLAYMSPEQARGEGHRVDGRSDIFNLGVVLYELLTGRLPFQGDTPNEVLDQIRTVDVRPPRQRDDRIPPELERICLKALSKRASDRYNTAQDMADDLWAYLRKEDVIPEASADGKASSPAEQLPVKIVPKGLRSFDAGDANFFLELLPGPRDREGLPESIRFWKTRIEETDADETFAVGLMYGPSGCGKSSLVKAGLLPRLADNVVVVYVEATAADTEARLLKRLRKVCPALPAEMNLIETLSTLRQGRVSPPGKKVLLVIDQFEQWLHAHGGKTDAELVEALRQCDGGHVQAIILVRDDFGMAATRFMNALEVAIVEGENFATVDRFDLDHAQRVLAAIGRAYGRISDTESLTPAQEQFLHTVVQDLAEEGRVICVRLALFAEMFKDRPWAPVALQEVGGLEGLGIAFLEQSVGERATNPKHRCHHKAARNVLQALLPELGSDIKGHMGSRDELLNISRYVDRPRDFDELMSILDRELRLVTPTELEGEETDESSAVPVHYQLTHDYLVPPLREWLTGKQKETWRGRAELRLTERAVQWNRTREGRFLPSLPEYLSIACGVPKAKRTTTQQEMMRAALRYHGLRLGTALAVLLIVALGLQWWVAGVRAENRRKTAEAAVNALLQASGQKVSGAIEDVRLLGDVALPMLQRKFADENFRPDYRLNAAYGLLDLGHVNDKVLTFVVKQVGRVSSLEFANMETAFRIGQAEAKRILARHVQVAPDLKTKCRLAVLLWHLGDESATAQLATPPADPKTNMIDPASRTMLIHEVFSSWHGEFSQVARLLEKEKSSALCAALCLALGLTPEDRLTANDSERIAPVLLEFYRSASDGATHSAAGWTLRQWSVPLPSLKRQQHPSEGRDWWHNTLGMTLVKIPAGSFMMGSAVGTTSREDPVHRVTLTKGFWLSDSEVTVGQFRQFAADLEYLKQYPDEEPKSWMEDFEKEGTGYSRTDDSPVNQVSWLDAVYFCNWASRKEGKQPCYKKSGNDWVLDSAGTGYRLPSEAEWEYACRAGAGSEFCYGDSDQLLSDYAVYATGRTLPTRSKLPNTWGLFDMHGNLWEWCNDWYSGDYYKTSPPAHDPQGPLDGSSRVVRGGSWSRAARSCCAAYRSAREPGNRAHNDGFRLAAVQSDK